jgi:glycosyltransferase
VIFRKWIAGEFSLKKIKYGWMPPHPTVFMKKAIYERTGGFDLRFKISADYEFLLRAFKNADFKSKYIPCLMVHMKLGGLSNRSWGNIKIKMIEDYRIMKENMMPALFSLFIKNSSKLRQLRRIF